MLSSSMVPSCLVGRFDSHLCKNPRRTGLLYESFACCSTPQNGDSSWQTHWTIQYDHKGGTATQGFASKYLGQKCTSRIRSHSSSDRLAETGPRPRCNQGLSLLHWRSLRAKH